tara:strand:- start:436 stop:1107 length:672 start_codon:yes stop_codon:yes gene_type:complete
MSVNVTKEWYYFLRGREILLYKLLGGSSTERVTQSGVFSTRSHELMYPDEDIANGLRVEYTALNEPFIAEALETTTIVASGTDISFSGNVITGGGTNDGFASGDKIKIQGSASNDGSYTTTGAGSNTLTDSATTFTTESAGERITITQIPKEVASPDETSHINLNKMLSLAVVDYIKAMKADRNGEIDKKEYYMKEFYSKLGDNESNIRKISMSFPSSPFAVR